MLLLLALLPAAGPPVDDAFFEAKVRPILVAHCQKCHNDAKTQGGLLLTSRDALVAGGDGGPALDAADPAKSRLLTALAYDGELRMPPRGKLADDNIRTLADWVRGGAPWPKTAAAAKTAVAAAKPLWSLTPPAATKLADIDALLQAKRDELGLVPAPEADRRTLIRRLAFDLTGLPPTPAEVRAFLDDAQPDAYGRLADRLLASPRYGERWARHWLDLARYAETHGHEFDFEIPNAWRYRDYVVRAFNDDLPYDRFVKEQVAGDLLPPRRHPVERWNEAKIATGFWCLGEAKHSPVDSRQEQADRTENMIDVFGKTFLGLTVACARCHDHKFDPVSAKDYYALYGVLSSSRYEQAFIDDEPEAVAAGGGESPRPDAAAKWRASATVESFGPGWRDRWSATGPAFAAASPASDAVDAGRAGSLRSPTIAITQRYAAVRVAADRARVRFILNGLQLIQEPIYGSLARTATHPGEYRWVVFDLDPWRGQSGYIELLDDGPGWFRVAEAMRGDVPPGDGPQPATPTVATGKLPVARRAPALCEGTGVDEFVMLRGNPKLPGEVAPRRAPAFLGGDRASPAAGSGRRELAEALVASSNPLTARVFVNRVWHHHFGVGLVPTPDDFGHQGTAPTHPELLDRLALDFVASGWRVKALHKRIVTTAAYRMSSRPDGVAQEKATSADPTNRLLSRQRVRRLEAEAVRDSVLAVSGRLDETRGGPGVAVHLTEGMDGRGRPARSGPLDGDGRRTLYLQVRRNFPNPLLAAFDAPTPFTAIGRRTVSNVPSQALVLLNNPFVQGQADRWAKRVLKSPGSTDDRVRGMVEAAFGREATAAELADARDFLADGDGAWPAYALALLNAKEFLFIP